MTNFWHDISAGEKSPEIVTAAIEISANSRAKYEICKETGALALDRILFSSMVYPANYGFIPQTLAEDNDPLDVVLLCGVDLVPLSLANARPVGVMKMIDGGEGDDKIIAVAEDDVTMRHVRELEDIPQAKRDEIAQFFKEYKNLEKKKVEVKEFHGKEVALQIIRDCMARYQDKFKE